MTRKNYYMDRALRHRDPRYAQLLGKLGYSTRHMVAADDAVTAPAKPHPLEHDGDGRKGGAKAGAGHDIKDLREQYQEIIGKRPFPGWDADELRKRIDEALGS